MRRIIISGHPDTIRAKVHEAHDDLTEDGQGYIQAKGVEGSTTQPDVEVEFSIIEDEDEIEDKEVLNVHMEEVPD